MDRKEEDKREAMDFDEGLAFVESLRTYQSLAKYNAFGAACLRTSMTGSFHPEERFARFCEGRHTPEVLAAGRIDGKCKMLLSGGGECACVETRGASHARGAFCIVDERF